MIRTLVWLVLIASAQSNGTQINNATTNGSNLLTTTTPAIQQDFTRENYRNPWDTIYIELYKLSTTTTTTTVTIYKFTGMVVSRAYRIAIPTTIVILAHATYNYEN